MSKGQGKPELRDAIDHLDLINPANIDRLRINIGDELLNCRTGGSIGSTEKEAHRPLRELWIRKIRRPVGIEGTEEKRIGRLLLQCCEAVHGSAFHMICRIDDDATIQLLRICGDNRIDHVSWKSKQHDIWIAA